MKKLVLLLILVGCAHSEKASEKDIDQYCQDLNVLYQKKAAIESNIANIKDNQNRRRGLLPSGLFFCPKIRLKSEEQFLLCF